MDISASQYNSASESGWTHYLDQSSLSNNYYQRRDGIEEYEGKGARMEEFEEDLSMVSDASSGPPHYDDECYCENWYPCLSSTSQYTKEPQKKKNVKEYGRSQQSSPLDDTASSPLFNCSKESHKVNVIDIKCVHIYSFSLATFFLLISCFVIEQNQVSFSGNGAVENVLDFSQCLSATRIKVHLYFYC